MNLEIKEEVLSLYETLIESGMIFYYGSETIGAGEITDFNINEENVEIEINGFENYEVSIEDFKENHIKEGANYHNFSDSRKFDNLLNELE